jgi:hypothetical protein
MTEETEHTQSVASTEPGIVEKFKKEVDVEEFKRKLIAQIMQSTAGRNPLDYYLAELAASVWLENFDKNPEELEELIRSTPFQPVGPPDEGVISVVDTEGDQEQEPLTYKDALLKGVEEEDERVDPVPEGAEEAQGCSR